MNGLTLPLPDSAHKLNSERRAARASEIPHNVYGGRGYDIAGLPLPGRSP
jgi:hypothetical protein